MGTFRCSWTPLSMAGEVKPLPDGIQADPAGLVHNVAFYVMEEMHTYHARVRITEETVELLVQTFRALQEKDVIGYWRVELMTLEIDSVDGLMAQIAALASTKKPRGRLAPHA